MTRFFLLVTALFLSINLHAQQTNLNDYSYVIIPDQFDFKGTVIFITNLKFDQVKSKKLADHLDALQSRCHYLDLTIDSMRDRMLRIKQICGAGMLDKYAMGQETQDDLVQFIFDNKANLREISLRMVLKIADLWKMAPDRYKELATQTCMKNGMSVTLPKAT